MNLTLSEGHYNLVYNSFSFVIPCMRGALVPTDGIRIIGWPGPGGVRVSMLVEAAS